MIDDYKPADLPEIDRIEVCTLAGRAHGEDKPVIDIDGEWRFLINLVVAVSGADAQRIASLWRNLPAGETDRCHNPRFGLRFYHRDNMLLEASVCWECNNVFLRTGAGWNGFNFDARSAPAQELLAICKVVTGRDE